LILKTFKIFHYFDFILLKQNEINTNWFLSELFNARCTKESDREKLKEDLEIVLRKWVAYMLKITKDKNEKAYKIKELDITMKPFIYDSFQVAQENLNSRIVLVVSSKEDSQANSTFWKSFSGSLIEIFKKALRSKWVAVDSKWFQILNIDTAIC
jgi:hypothetical protein